jgi:hypothetical protein
MHHANKTRGGVEVYHQAFLDSELDRSECSASGSGRLTPGKRSPGTDSSLSLDVVGKRRSRRESNMKSAAVQCAA